MLAGATNHHAVWRSPSIALPASRGAAGTGGPVDHNGNGDGNDHHNGNGNDHHNGNGHPASPLATSRNGPYGQ